MEVHRSRHLEVSCDGEPVCSADVTVEQDAGSSARLALHSEAGHIPPGSRAKLVDQVLSLPELQGCERLGATLPRGDDESLVAFKQRCDDVVTRVAGATVILDAHLRRQASQNE